MRENTAYPILSILMMPAWGPRLTEAEIKAVTLYVHQLGGGE